MMSKDKDSVFIKHLQRSSEARNIKAMIEMARSEPGMTRKLIEFDADPMLLGVANGVLDLRRGALLPISPSILVTKRCRVKYDPSAKCPLFMKFLEEVHPDRETRGFLKRLMGYCLTGKVGEGLFVFFYGHGASGKTVYVEIFSWILGDYARKIPTEMLMQHQRNPQGSSPDIVGLKGMRMIYANETEEGRRLDDARIKDMTGGDSLTGRVPYAKVSVTFDPTFKLFIGEQGLNVPESIRASTAAYRGEQDVLGEWIEVCCRTGSGCSVSKSALYSNYKDWCEENGHRPMAQTRLTRRLKDRGYNEDAGRRNMFGIELSGGQFAASIRSSLRGAHFAHFISELPELFLYARVVKGFVETATKVRKVRSRREEVRHHSRDATRPEGRVAVAPGRSWWHSGPPSGTSSGSDLERHCFPVP